MMQGGTFYNELKNKKKLSVFERKRDCVCVCVFLCVCVREKSREGQREREKFTPAMQEDKLRKNGFMRP